MKRVNRLEYMILILTCKVTIVTADDHEALVLIEK